MEGRFEEREFAQERYWRYCETVTRETDPERLLIYDVSEGWGPLCRFLELEEPGEPFPRKNARARFQQRNRSDVGAGGG